MRPRTIPIRAGLAATVCAIALVVSGTLSPLRAEPVSSACATAPKPAPGQRLGSSTCLPIPRFVSLRADAVNLRVGPGDQYPIAWVYHRVGLPVEVLREFDVWRLVVDSDGTEGWMHEATLIDSRHFIINTSGPVTLYHGPSDQSEPAAQLMPGVIGLIERCDAGAGWCRVRVDHIGGWLERSAFWGSFPGEAIPAR